MNYQDYVCGTKFRDIADFVVDKELCKPSFIRKEPNIPIYYAHTHEAKYAFAHIGRDNTPSILITHNSDGKVKWGDRAQVVHHDDADFSLLPSNVVKWYAQNVDLTDEMLQDEKVKNKIVPIPIGLENSYCFPYDKAAMLFEKTKQTHTIKHKFYVNFNPNTNPSERTKALNYCKQLNDKDISIRLAQNGEDYDAYLNDLVSHIGIVSPRGNGLDCHRTWEALYLGRVPVMLDIPSFASWDLPIYTLNHWHDLIMVENILDFIYDFKKHWNKFNLKALSFKYWQERITNGK